MPKTEFVCINCNTAYQAYECQNRKFCSRRCADNYKSFFNGPKDLSVAEWAYIAGMIDGEGTIGIAKQNKMANLRPYIRIDNTHEQTIAELASLLDAPKTVNYSPGEKWRTCHRLTIQAREQVIWVLEGVMPYLRIKRERAEIALDAALNGSTPEMHLTMKALNQRGSIPS